MLGDEQLRAAWARYGEYTSADDNREFYQGWWGQYRAHVSAVQAVSSEELATPRWQERLWIDKSITPAGPGDSIDVRALYEDVSVVQPIVALRQAQWSSVTTDRAAEIQRAYNEQLEHIATKNVRVRPAAKLKRIFVALLPRELTCALPWGANRRAASLLVPDQGRGHLAFQVLMRQRLRDVLGAEEGLDDDVARSCFCWWLHENYERLSTGDVGTAPTSGGVEPGASTLELWPFGKQYKSIPAPRGLTDAYQTIIQSALPRVTRDDLVEMLRSHEAFVNVQPKSIRATINTIKGLGLLEEEAGLVFPSRAGEAFMEDDEPSVLVEALLQRAFGFAQLLRALSEAPAGVPFEQLVAAFGAMYPNWTTSWPVKGLLGWSQALGLVDQAAPKLWALSDYGRAWTSRLPRQLPMPSSDRAVSAPELGADEIPVEPPAQFPAFGEIFQCMEEKLPETAGFVFDRRQAAALDAAWRMSDSKRFAILSGLSGTGKTAIVKHYASAVCTIMGLDVKDHLEVVPVLPDWRDPTGIFGYLNALHDDPSFQAEPALRLILRADRDPTRPYFLMLDEMNLARVEQYFAPMLSIMETGLDFRLHTNGEPINDVPPSITWPRNLYIAGTVNMDESTHPFSDKVLDRAFTLEFWEVNLPAFFARREQAGKRRVPSAEKVLLELHGLLAPVRRHFGYRTAGEVLDFVTAMEGPAEEALDFAVFAKVLPRLRGEDTTAFSEALQAVTKACAGHGLERCAAKASAMLDQLRHTGVTKFWA